MDSYFLFCKGYMSTSKKEGLVLLAVLCEREILTMCQLHGEKGLEGTTFHNANTQKGK